MLVSFFMCAHAVTLRADGNASAPAADLYNKAVRLYEKHRWAAAKEYLHQYLAEYSDTPLYITCLYYLAYCYQQLKDTHQAVIIYNKVMDQAKQKEREAFWGEMAQRRIQELDL